MVKYFCDKCKGEIAIPYEFDLPYQVEINNQIYYFCKVCRVKFINFIRNFLKEAV